MGKVNLNKSSKPKNTDFKRRKAALGRGKHQHLSHTKIDMKTMQIKVLSQSRFENTEVIVEGPTVEQMNNLINMSHSDNQKKILEGLKGLSSILSKAPNLFVQNTNSILGTALSQIRNSDENVRNQAQNLISYLFNNFPDLILPLLSTIIRHILTSAVSQSQISKVQASLLLEKVASLPHLQPTPILFGLFPRLIEVSTTPRMFSTFTKPIVKILNQFAQRSNESLTENIDKINFPRLFPTDAKTFSKRFTSKSALTTDEITSLDQMLQNIIKILPKIKGDEGQQATIDMCTLVLSIKSLLITADIQPFIDFVVSSGWPFDKIQNKKNLICAKLIAYDEKHHELVREFIEETPSSGCLIATVGGIPRDDALDGVDYNELCETTIREDMQPSVCSKLAHFYLTEEHPPKKILTKMIHLKKPDDFQTILAELLETKLVRTVQIPNQKEKEEDDHKEEEEISEATYERIVKSDKERQRQELLINLTASCEPFCKEFLQRITELIRKKVESDDSVYYIPTDLASSLIKAIAMTRKTETNFLISFLMSCAISREDIRPTAKICIEYLKGYARDEKEANLFNKIDTNEWKIIKKETK